MKIKILLLCSLFLFIGPLSNSQIVNGSFEDTGTCFPQNGSIGSAFSNNCLGSSWICNASTPSVAIENINGNPPAFDGTQYATVALFDGESEREAFVFRGFDITAHPFFEFSMAVRSRSQSIGFKVIAVDTEFLIPSCDDFPFVFTEPPASASMEIVSGVVDEVEGWQVITVNGITFDPGIFSGTTTNLLFFPLDAGSPITNEALFIDQVTFGEGSCEPLPIPIFHLENENEEEKTVFCFGEQIILDGRESLNETSHYVSVETFDETGQFVAYAKTGNIWTPFINPVNLNDLLIAENDPGNTFFKPGFTYIAKLAVGNDCDPWEEETLEFTVVCCNDMDMYSATPNFTLNDLDHEDDHYSIEAINYELHDHLHANHEWYVYTEENGVNTPIAILTGETFYFEPVEYGIEYFVIHKVITECEERCFQTCISNGGGGMLLGQEESTCLGEEVDCSIIEDIWPPCGDLWAPTNLQSNDGNFTWSPVPGAESYTISIQFGDTDCHCGSQSSFAFNIGTTENTSLPIPDWLVNRCFQWTVTANCGDELTSAISTPACHYPVQLNDEEGNGDNRSDYGNNNPLQKDLKEYKVSIFPNPAKDNFTLDNNSPNNIQVEVYSTNGQLMTSKQINSNSQQSFDTKSMISGIYILQIKDPLSGNLIESKKLSILK